MNEIERLRQNAGLTQRQLADAVKVTESTIRNWEHGRNGTAMVKKVYRLCRALNCSLEDLMQADIKKG
ncbi:MAG: XRE family transcriptional regulator [Oceanospirillales bacterium]|nr:MAG: XRE family transcriptional regulator [Oceanospirillales bacterium]